MAGVKLAGDVLVTAVADEEYASIGMEDLVKQFTADAAIVTEPTDLHFAGRIAALSGTKLRQLAAPHTAAVTRKASTPTCAWDAFWPTGQIGTGTAAASRPSPGRTTLTACLPTARRQRNQHLRRPLPAADGAPHRAGRNGPGATAELQAIIDLLASQDPTFRATVRPAFWREPFVIDADAPIVQTLERALTNHLGGEAIHTGQTFWTDAAILADAGIDTVLIGPKGYGLHSAEEWVDLQSVSDLAEVLAQTALDYCGQEQN